MPFDDWLVAKRLELLETKKQREVTRLEMLAAKEAKVKKKTASKLKKKT